MGDLEPVPWFIDGGGAAHSGSVARLISYAAFNGREGIVGESDLAVKATIPTSGNVQVLPGAYSALSRYTDESYQSYAGRLPTAHTLAIPPTTSAGDRWDMIITRVRDPYPTGSGDSGPVNPVVGPYNFIELITDIEQYVADPAAVQELSDLGLNITGVGLSLLHVPVSTATITNAMLFDIRYLMNPMTERVLRTQRGGTQTGGVWDEAGDITASYENWPQHTWTMTIPPWATQAQILGNWDNTYLIPTGATGGLNDARGDIKIRLDDGLGNIIETVPAAYNFNQTSTSNGYRCSMSSKSDVSVPSIMRGREVTISMRARGEATWLGRLRADSYAHFSVDTQFNQTPAPPATL